MKASPSSLATLCVALGCGQQTAVLVRDTELVATDTTDGSTDGSTDPPGTLDPTVAESNCNETWPGPFAYYRFDECTHLVRERMRSGLDATLVTGRCDDTDLLSDTLANSWSSGGALACPAGEVGCARIAEGLPFATDGVTISLWVKAEDWRLCEFEDSPPCTLIGIGDSSDEYGLRSDRGALSFAAPDTPSPAVGPSIAEPGRWHHVVATLDASGSRVYLNGVPGPVGSPPSLPQSAFEWLGTPGSGAILDDASPDDLRLDEILLWDFAMTPDEVRALFERYAECGAPINL